MSYHINTTGKMLAAAAVTRAAVGGPITREEKKGCILASLALVVWQLTILAALFKLLSYAYHGIFD